MFNKIVFALPALVVSLSLATIPVYARNGADDTIKASHTAGSTRDSASSDHETLESHPEVEVASHSADVKEVETHNTTHANRLIEAEMQKQGVRKHSAAERESNCKKHQKGLDTKLGNLGKNADKHKSHIDGVLTKALAFQTDKNLNPDGFADLVSKAQTAQANAVASISALKALTVNVDCANPNVAYHVATFKAAAAQVRTDLFAYRDAVKAALKTLENVAPRGSN